MCISRFLSLSVINPFHPINQWQVCHGTSWTAGLCATGWPQLYCDAPQTILKWHMKHHPPPPNIILSTSATIWCCNSQNLFLELTHNIHMHLNTYRVYIKIYISGFTAICIVFSLKKGLRLNKNSKHILKRRLVYSPVKMGTGRPDRKVQIIQIYAKY